MPAFAPRQTHVTATPVIEVDGLPVGIYRFRLVVEDEQGAASLPAEAVVEVVEPTPILRHSILRTTLEPLVRPTLINPRLIR
jgi:hypothetical protein